MVLVEGPRALETTVEFGAEIVFAVVDESTDPNVHADLLAALADRRVPVDRVAAAVFREFASTETPQGILAVAREPAAPWPPDGDFSPGNRARSKEDPARVLVLDRVRDPGNVGTLVRTAAALGVQRVVALPGTADPWGSKVVRASAGTVFSLPVHAVGWEDLAAWLDQTGIVLLVADAGGADVRRRPRGGPWALVVANETTGPAAAVLDRAEAVVSIPMVGGVESLNVAIAGAILLWTLGPGGQQESNPS